MHQKRSLVLSLVILISLGLAGATLGIASAMQSGALSQSAVELQQIDRSMASAVHPSGPEEVFQTGTANTARCFTCQQAKFLTMESRVWSYSIPYSRDV